VRLLSDGRTYQVATLGILLTLSMVWLDFGATPFGTAAALAGSVGTQILCARFWRLPAIDVRSALITGCSLGLLLRTNDPVFDLAAGVIAILSKFVLRVDGRHIWNPACFAIVVLKAIFAYQIWISPGQWGSTAWFGAFALCLGALVLQRSRRIDTGLFFLGVYATLLCCRAVWLGDPWAIPLHQLQSGSLIIFSCFMVTDPRTTPNRRAGRLLFAAGVALLGYYLAFFEQWRPALYVSLFLLAPLVPLIDRILPGTHYRWGAMEPKARGA